MGQLVDAFLRAARGTFTRDIPKTPKGRLNALIRAEKGNVRAVADRLGVTPRTVERWVKGTRRIERTNRRTLDRLEQEVTKSWQPRIQQRAQRRAGRDGVQIDTRARFGFTAPRGSSDDPRMRHLTEFLPPAMAQPMIEAAYRGDEAGLARLLEDGLAEAYFRERGTPAVRAIEIDFTDIDYFDAEW